MRRCAMRGAAPSHARYIRALYQGLISAAFVAWCAGSPCFATFPFAASALRMRSGLPSASRRRRRGRPWRSARSFFCDNTLCHRHDSQSPPRRRHRAQLCELRRCCQRGAAPRPSPTAVCPSAVRSHSRTGTRLGDTRLAAPLGALACAISGLVVERCTGRSLKRSLATPTLFACVRCSCLSQRLEVRCQRHADFDLIGLLLRGCTAGRGRVMRGILGLIRNDKVRYEARPHHEITGDRLDEEKG